MRIFYATSMGLEKEKMHGNKFHFLELSSNLAKHDNEVHIIYPQYKNTIPSDFMKWHLNAIPIKVGKKNKFSYLMYHIKLLFCLKGLIKKYNPKIFYERDLIFSKRLFRKIKKLNIPVISEINGIPRNKDEKDRMGEIVRKKLLKDIIQKLKYADKIRVVVKQQKEILEELNPQASSKIEVITIGTNTEIYKPLDKNKARSSVNHYLKQNNHHFTIDKDDYLIVFLGALNYGPRAQGVIDLIESLSQIKNKTIKFLIVGPGTKLEDVKQKYKELEMESTIRSIGEVDYFLSNQFINSADLCFLPQLTTDKKQEGLSLKLSSYMAAGKRILASKVPGIEEKVLKFDGLVWDGSDLKQKVLSAVKTQKEWDKGEEERDFIIKNHSWVKISKDLDELLKIIIKDQ